MSTDREQLEALLLKYAVPVAEGPRPTPTALPVDHWQAADGVFVASCAFMKQRKPCVYVRCTVQGGRDKATHDRAMLAALKILTGEA